VRVVIDTNVIVSGLLSPAGPCGGIVRLMVDGAFVPCYSSQILAEYHEVLHRARFRFDPLRVEIILEQIQHCGLLAGPLVTSPSLPDPDDQAFLEAALSARAACIVTGNAAHFPARVCRPVEIVSPARFLKLLSAEG
jgi:putative PIN family toxin of toxin-antitoxin system